jgi:iron complex outermembrane recepter protein
MGRSESKLVSCQKLAWQPLILPTPVRLLVASAGLAAIGFGQAFAESPAASDDSATPIQEIVVTAEKRESTVQHTPFSITAISGDQLLERGLTSLEDVATQTPGISMKQFAPGETEYEMRGLPSTGGSSATVGLYLNEIPMSAPANSFQGKAMIDPTLFDLQRVEVLRGPQGTLYGAGSMGGTIRIITAPPVFNTLQAASQTTLSGTKNGGFNWGQSGMINLPLIDDKLALRLVGTDTYDNGWIDRVVVNPFPIGAGGTCGWIACTRGDVQGAPVVSRQSKTNWERTLGGRAALKYQPIDDLTIDMFFMYQGLHTGAFPQVDASVGIDNLAHYQPNNIDTPFADTFRIWGLTVNYDMGFARLTSASSAWNHTSTWVGEDSEAGQVLIGTFFGDPTPYTDLQFDSDHTEQISQEIRLASEGNGPLQWLIGGYFSNFESISSAYSANPAVAYLSIGGADANPLGIGFQQRNPYFIKQYAAFSEVSYLLTPALKATVGLRYYRFSSELDSFTAGLFGPTGNATPTTTTETSTASGVNPKFNLSYEPSKDLTLYTQIAKGFRPGGVNYPPPANLCPGRNGTYVPDYIWNYEVGEKARFADGRISVNADLYYIRLYNSQQLLTLPCSYVFTTNVGTGESYGPEVEISAKLTKELSFSVSGTYTTAHIVSVNPSLAGSTIGSTETLVPGIPLLNVPKYSVSSAIDYAVPLNDSLTLTARLNATTTGPSYDLNYYVERLPSYTIADARIGLRGGHWDGYLFARNLTNKIAALTVDTLAYFAPTPALSIPAVTTPRTVGVQLNYKY